MPVSHIGLTVSHLPTSCSFFLSALQPLGYRFIGQQGNQIGLGINDADFFICQETAGMKAGAAHIAFTAPSRTAVRDFYTAALNAGGRPNGAPSCRVEETGHFNAAILDFDGNSIEVVYRNAPDLLDDGTVIEHSRVITWQRDVAESARDDRSVVSSRTARSSASRPRMLEAPPAESVRAPSVKAESVAPSIVSKATSMSRSVSAPVAVQQASQPITTTITQTTSVSTNAGEGAAKRIIGTLLGAAAGAAVAYAMCKSEEDSAKQESEFNAFQRAKDLASSVAAQTALPAPTTEQPKLSVQAPQPVYEAPPKSVHRNISDTDSYYSTPQARSAYVQRAIEPAPRSYHSPSYASVPPTQVADRPQIEYVPAVSVAPSRAYSLQRSVTSPDVMSSYSKARSMAPSGVSHAKSHVSKLESTAQTAIESFKAKSVAPSAVESHHSSKPKSVAPSAVESHYSKARSTAPSTLISSFVPDAPTRRSSEGSITSHHSSKSKARSEAKSSHSKHSSKSRTRAPSPTPSKPGSIIGSLLGRDTVSGINKKDFLDIGDINDSDTVAPSDSISNAGSRRSHRSHRSHKSSSKDSDAGSKHSSHSKHSKSSKHSKKSGLSQEWFNQDLDVVKPSVVSEPSDASTVKPSKSKVSARKDSVVGGQYERALGDMVGYGVGSVASLPVRGLTPSMIDNTRDGKGGKRSVVSYAN